MIWRVVIIDGLRHDNAGASYGQRELVRRRLERQCELRREPEQVERWQSGVLPKLWFFSSATVEEFLFGNLFLQPFFPPAQLPANF